MKRIIVLVCLLNYNNVFAKTYELPYDIHIDISGYVGWRQMFSNVKFDAVPSEPELGLLANLQVTDRLRIFNQFKYGTTINEILVYNKILYTPDIPIDDFELTFRGGKIRYDNLLYNATRVNPRTRQGVFQPQAIYWNPMAQTVTSGTGGGVDIKYKNLTVSYVLTDQTSVNSDLEAKAWTRANNTTNYKTKFGSYQLATIGYEIPEYGIRTRSSWEGFKATFDVINGPKNNDLSGQRLSTGIEWIHNDWTLSVEGFCLQRGSKVWNTFSGSFCAISPTVEYDITPEFSARINYNQYRTPGITQAKTPGAQAQTYSKDLNLGFGWHKGQWLANVQVNYIQGGRLVDPYNFAANPTDYKNFYVVGTNLVWFWE